MSLTTTLAVNSGPLILRTYNDLARTNTYLLTAYDVPVSSNQVLVTSTNGQVVPTSQPVLSSLIVGSTLFGNNQTLSTLAVSSVVASSVVASSIGTGPLAASSLVVAGPALYTASIQNFTANGGNPVIDSSWWGKYNFITSATDATGYILSNIPRPANGTFLTITNAQPDAPSVSYPITVTGVTILAGGDTRTIALHSTLRLLYNSSVNRWYSLTNN